MKFLIAAGLLTIFVSDVFASCTSEQEAVLGSYECDGRQIFELMDLAISSNVVTNRNTLKKWVVVTRQGDKNRDALLLFKRDIKLFDVSETNRSCESVLPIFDKLAKKYSFRYTDRVERPNQSSDRCTTEEPMGQRALRAEISGKKIFLLCWAGSHSKCGDKKFTADGGINFGIYLPH